jgi:hypothetical protein
MSSPGARQRRRRQQYQSPRTRADVVTAVVAGVSIVAGTALMIWLLRPGGIADRQPRSSWLVGGALIIAVVTVYALRPAGRFDVNRKVAVPGALGAIVVLAVIAGVLWPHGLLRHTPKLAPIDTSPAASISVPSSVPGTPTTASGATSTAPATTAAGSSTSAAATTTSGP